MTESEWFQLPNGIRLSTRPVQPTDADQLQALINGLSPCDRRWRFHGTVNGVTPQRLQAMVDPRAPHQLALATVAHLPGRDVLVADARCATDSTGCAAEFALMVAAGWRRTGVGEHTLHALQVAAADQGLRWLYGSVLTDNAPMLALVQRLGFHCTPHRGDERVVLAEACLASASNVPRMNTATSWPARGAVNPSTPSL